MQRTAFLFFVFISLVHFAVAQRLPDSASSQEHVDHQIAEQYREKGRKQKKAGTVLMIAGGAMVTSGLIVALTNSGSESRGSYSSLGPGGGLAVGGGVLLCSGLTIYVIGTNQEKKGKLTVTTSRAMTPYGNFSHQFPALSIRIGL